MACRSSSTMCRRGRRQRYLRKLSASGSAARLGSFLLTRSSNGFAGLVHHFEREIHNRAGILDDVLQALSHETALDGGEILHRAAVCELAQPLNVALDLLLSQAAPLSRGVLKGSGQHGAELRDRF